MGTADTAMLFSAAASMTEIAGWMSHDGGENTNARSFFDRAFRLASAAENDALAGNACASMAHLAIESGQHADALRIAGAGLHRAAPAPGAIRLVARLHAMRARAFAAMGDSVTCARELDVAEMVLTRAGAESPAAWIAGFDEASLASEASLCFLDMAEFSEAERRATEVIRLRSGDRVRSRAFGQLTLARVLVGAGRVEEAAQLGRELCRTVESLSSARVTSRLNDLGDALESAHDVPEVTQFIKALKALSPGADSEEGQAATWPV